jgi:hypothetical protein
LLTNALLLVSVKRARDNGAMACGAGLSGLLRCCRVDVVSDARCAGALG